jgi:hypothetical protein
MRRAFLVLVAFVSLCAISTASAAGLRLTIWPTPPVFSGTAYSFGVYIEKEDRNDGIVHTAPFTFRTTLPAGVAYTGWNGNWTCSTPPNDLRDVTCVYNTSLDFWNPGSGSLQINATVSPTVTPGPVAIVGTLQNAQVPLPPNPACAASPSTTGCASSATNYVASQVRINDWGYTNGTVTNGPVAVWTGGPFEAGAQGMIVIGTTNTGYGPTNTPVTLEVTLPDGLSYAGIVAANPAFTCAPQTPPTRVRCTTPYFYDTLYAFLSMRVDVAQNVAVPGPLFVHASIGNNVQVPPADCVATPLQTGCGRLQISTRTPRVATIVGDSITHTPATFVLGQEPGPIVVSYRNVGEATSGQMTFWTQLPPYFEFIGTFASNPAATCAAQGTIAAGHVVRCTVAAVGAAPFGDGYVSLRVFAHRQAASPGPLPVVAAFDLADPSSAAMLASCVANPAQAFCAHDAIPTLFRCAMQFEDGVFCDGFQPFVRPPAARADESPR